MSFPAEYQSAPFDFTEWPDSSLKLHATSLARRKEQTGIPRQRTEIEREIGHVLFEMVCRTHDFDNFDVRLDAELVGLVGQPAGSSQLI